jgi:hypothetical protein
MSIIPLTVFFSLLLAGLFVVLFLVDRNRSTLGGAERDSLMPLADEGARPAAVKVATSRGAEMARSEGRQLRL